MPYPIPPTAVDLAFSAPAGVVSPSAVDLTFGASGGPRDVYPASFSARFVLRAQVSVLYNVGTWRGLSGTTVAGFGQGRASLPTTALTWEPPAQAVVLVAAAYEDAQQAHTSAALAWEPPQAAGLQRAAAWGATAAPVQTLAAADWAAPLATSLQRRLAMQQARPVGQSANAFYSHSLRTMRDSTSRWARGKDVQRAVTTRHNQKALAAPTYLLARWQGTRLVASYGGPQYLPPPRAVVPVQPITVVDLRFCALYPATDRTTLVFGVDPCSGNNPPTSTLYILPARFYMAVHSITAHLLPGLTSLPIYGVSLSADSGSFAWSFSASGPASLFDALAPTGGVPAQIRITLDGIPWVFVVDSVQRTDSFGQRGSRISGRSATALVGAPYSRETARLNSTAQNAQQLAAAALDLSGVGLDWGITDWLVPPGAWSHTGTPLAAVQSIAEAAGGYVNSHRANPTLLLRHPYPTLPGGIPGGPWNWGGAFPADVELAPSSVITSSIERRDGPDTDGVYVSGTAQGVLALVRRTGTQGAKLAQMVTDPLITANAAAQQRGLSVLGTAGPKHLVQISLPVLTGASQPGVLDVGQLVQINDSAPWRGRVRSVSVQANMPSIRQSVTLERHLG